MAGRRSWRPSSRISDSKIKCDQNSISYSEKKDWKCKQETISFPKLIQPLFITLVFFQHYWHLLYIYYHLWKVWCDIANFLLNRMPALFLCSVLFSEFRAQWKFKAFCFAFILSVFRDEVKLTRKIGSLRYFYSSAYFFSAIWVIMAAVVPQALTTGITVRRIFTTLSYCMVLRMTVTRQLPASIQMWYDTIRLIWKIEVKNVHLIWHVCQAQLPML